MATSTELNEMEEDEQSFCVLPWYEPHQWDALRAIDPDVEKTWDQWNAEGNQLIAELKRRGISYVQIPVDVAELQQYCEEQGIPNDSPARCKFVRAKYNQKEKMTTEQSEQPTKKTWEVQYSVKWINFTATVQAIDEEEAIAISGKLDFDQ
jgi:hypothetical protein